MSNSFLRTDSQNNSHSQTSSIHPETPEQLLNDFHHLSETFSGLFRLTTGGVGTSHDEFRRVTNNVRHIANGLKDWTVDFDDSVLKHVVKKAENMLSDICSIDGDHEHSSAMLALGQDLLDLHRHACCQVAKLSEEQT